MQDLLRRLKKADGSDLFITAGFPPAIKVDGEIKPVTEQPLTPQQSNTLVRAIMNDRQTKAFDATKECNFAIAPPNIGRFRVSAFVQQGQVGCVCRTINTEIPTIEELELPPILKDIVMTKRGLVILVGGTGTGKSTTLAAMIDYINDNRPDHILTIEDPIEFVHESRRCLINQREVHRDTLGFNEALRSALREDPDVILVGEMRDLETIRLALTAAETGHLVFGTLHTSSAAKTVDRIVDVFPAGEKDMVRSMLSESLRAVISQTLLKKNGGGRIAAHEIMIGTPAIRNLIREGKIAQMYSAIQTGHGVGMQTLDQCLQDLLAKGLVSREEARYKAQNKEAF
jgi:twitching motility protein PilT